MCVHASQNNLGMYKDSKRQEAAISESAGQAPRIYFHFFNFFSFDDVKRQTMLQRKSCIADITFGKKSPISSTLFITNNGVSSITFELSCGGNNVATISHIWKMSFLSIPM